MAEAKIVHSFVQTCIIYVVMMSCLSEGVCGSPVYRRLIRGLLQDYDPLVRPVFNHTMTTEVHMQFYVSQILELSERHQHLQLNAWVTLLWKDEYLHWNATEHENIQGVKFPANRIWIPQVVLYQNADDQYRDFMSKEIVKVSPSGDIMWAAPVVFLSYCTVDTYYFPFDKQACQLKFGPWQYDGREVALDGGGDVSVYTGNGEWDMLDITSENHIEYYPDDPGVPYTDVTYTLHLKRRPIFYVFTLLMPCFLLCAVAVVDFFLPTESGEKVSLAITILLSMTVFLLLFAESMPATDVIPIIGQFYAASVFLVTFSLITSVVVSSYHFSGSERGFMSPGTKRFIFSYLGPVVGVSPFKEALAPSCAPSNGVTLINYARKDSGGSQQLADLHVNDTRVEHNGKNKMDAPNHALAHLRREIERLTSFHEQKAQEDHWKREWRHFAMIMDRCFMVIYTIGFIATMLMVICQL